MKFNREQKKKWFTHPSGAQYFIGFLPHAAHRALIEQVSNEVRAEANPLPVEQFSARLLSLLLFDWKNICDADDVEIPFSFEAIDGLFNSDLSGEFHEHARWIAEKALDPQAFNDSEQVLKNLQAPLNGAAHIHEQQLHTA